jgi:hypothetical protein
MGDQTSSAKPHQLLAYCTETQKINDALQRHHSPLIEALQRFQSTCTDFPVPCDLALLPAGLSRLVVYAQERDTWVRDVGLEFLAADNPDAKAKTPDINTYAAGFASGLIDPSGVLQALLVGYSYSGISASNVLNAIIDAIQIAIAILKKGAEEAKAERDKQNKEISKLIAEKKYDEAIQLTIKYYKIDASIAKSITYDSSVSGEASTTQSGKVSMGDVAFATPGWLASSIQHELVHVQQIKDRWYLGPQGTAINEIEAYDLEIRNAEQNALTDDQIKDLQKRRKDYYDLLDEENKKRIDNGDYTLPDDKKDT